MASIWERRWLIMLETGYVVSSVRELPSVDATMSTWPFPLPPPRTSIHTTPGHELGPQACGVAGGPVHALSRKYLPLTRVCAVITSKADLSERAVGGNT